MDPNTGSFLSVDPLSQLATQPEVSPYLYVEDQPTVMGDPTGLQDGLDSSSCTAEACYVNSIGYDAQTGKRQAQSGESVGQNGASAAYTCLNPDSLWDGYKCVKAVNKFLSGANNAANQAQEEDNGTSSSNGGGGSNIRSEEYGGAPIGPSCAPSLDVGTGSLQTNAEGSQVVGSPGSDQIQSASGSSSLNNGNETVTIG